MGQLSPSNIEPEHDSWRSLPSADQVHGWLRLQSQLKAKVRSIKLEIQLEEARIGKKKPRDTSARVIGVDEEQSPIVYLRKALLDAEANLDEIESELKMFEFRRDIFRALAYKERL
jgi:hypothetical protein